MACPFLELPTWDAKGNVLVVVETPKGSPFKLRLEPKLGVFAHQRHLRGLRYPHDWGFVARTRAPDGDPLDAMILHDDPTWPGVVIPSRPLLVLKLRERPSADSAVRDNHRVLLAPADGVMPSLEPARLAELEEFFLTVGRLTKEVWSEGWGDVGEATALIAKSAQ